MTDFMRDLGITMLGHLLSWESRIMLLYAATTLAIVFGLWLYRGRPDTFWRWTFPKRIYRHKSNIVDIHMFIFNTLLGVLGVFAAIGFSTAVTVATMDVLGNWVVQPIVAEIPTLWHTVLATFLMILTFDFCKYWAHYLHHENRFLWPFHALHHSAEVLTPLTAYRNHPVFLFVRSVITSIIVGTVVGIMLFFVMGEVSVLTIGSANAGYVIFNILGSNLRHSHIWLSYGRTLEHIFISPAQHQIHHSSAPKHHNKNYGEVFAFWDWMFGTLYVPAEQEILAFGLADAQGNPIEQPHPTLAAALFHPFVENWQTYIAKDTSKRIEPQ